MPEIDSQELDTAPYSRQTLQLWNFVNGGRPQLAQGAATAIRFAAALTGKPLLLPIRASMRMLSRGQLGSSGRSALWDEDVEKVKELALQKTPGCTSFKPTNETAMDKKEEKNKRLELIRAVRLDYEKGVKSLISEKANLEEQDEQGSTSLHWAACKGLSTITKTLLAAKANIESRDHEGRTPLHEAAYKGRYETVKLLLAAKANIEAEDQYGQTPLQQAALNAQIEVIKRLLLAKADINSRNKQNNPLLIQMIKYGTQEVTELLVEHKADLHARNSSGQTPLMCATIWSQESFLKTLYKAGADLEAHDGEGWTALAMAMALRREMVLPLRRLGGDLRYVIGFLANKRLAHMWGISGESSVNNQKGNYSCSFLLEGWSAFSAMQTLFRHVSCFFASDAGVSTVLTKKAKQEILTSLNYPVSYVKIPEGTMQRLSLGQSISILGGYTRHLIGMVLYKDHLDRYQLVICNRGNRHSGHTTKIHLIAAKHVNIENLDRLRLIHETPEEFFKTIDSLELGQIDGYSQKLQKIGICAWVGPKSLLRFIFERYVSRASALAIYKRFIRYSARPNELEEYITGHHALDVSLLRKIERKASAKPYPALSPDLLEKLEAIITQKVPKEFPRFHSAL